MFRRRLWMAGNLKLSKLERVIQEAFGWTNSHLVAFRIAGERFGMTDIESVDGDENLNDCSGSYDQTTKSWSMDTKPPGVVERKPSFAGGNRRENC